MKTNKYLLITDVLFLVIAVFMLIDNAREGDTFFTIVFALLTVAMGIIVKERSKNIKIKFKNK